MSLYEAAERLEVDLCLIDEAEAVRAAEAWIDRLREIAADLMCDLARDIPATAIQVALCGTELDCEAQRDALPRIAELIATADITIAWSDR